MCIVILAFFHAEYKIEHIHKKMGKWVETYDKSWVRERLVIFIEKMHILQKIARIRNKIKQLIFPPINMSDSDSSDEENDAYTLDINKALTVEKAGKTLNCNHTSKMQNELHKIHISMSFITVVKLEKKTLLKYWFWPIDVYNTR